MEKENNNNKTNKQKRKGRTCGFYQHKRISGEAARRNNSRLAAAASEAIVWQRVSLNAQRQIKYIILSFTPLSRSSGDSQGGRKSDEERRAY